MNIINIRIITILIICLTCFSTLLFGQNVIWLESDFDNPELIKSNSDGIELESVPLPSGSQPQSLALNIKTDSMYWGSLNFTAANIYCIASDFSIPTAIVDSQSVVRGMAVDTLNNMIYWTSTNQINGSKICRAGLNGESPEELIAFEPGSKDTPWEICIDAENGQMYWTNYYGGKIQRADMVIDAISEDVVTGLTNPAGLDLDLDAGQMFWTEVGEGTIKSANLAGSSENTLLSNLSMPYYLSVNHQLGRMAWIDLSTGKIKSANVDGSDVITYNIAATAPRGLILEYSGVSSVKKEDSIAPIKFALQQNYPNPFNPSTIIKYEVSKPSYVKLIIYNMLGERIQTLVDKKQEQGRYTVTFNAYKLSSGVYFCRLIAGSFKKTIKLMYIE